MKKICGFDFTLRCISERTRKREDRSIEAFSMGNCDGGWNAVVKLKLKYKLNRMLSLIFTEELANSSNSYNSKPSILDFDHNLTLHNATVVYWNSREVKETQSLTYILLC